MKKTLFQRRPAWLSPGLAAVVALGLVSLGLHLYSTWTWERGFRQSVPVLAQTNKAILRLSQAHLRLEELLAGDNRIPVERVWGLFAQAEQAIADALKGKGPEPAVSGPPPEDQPLRQRLVELRKAIADFRRLARRRWAARDQAGGAGPLGQDFHIQEQRLLAWAAALDRRLRASLTELEAERRRRYWTMVIAWLVTLGLLVMVLGRAEARRRRTGETLRASEDRYRDLVEHIHDLICTHDLQGRVLSVNRAAATLVGYDPEYIVQEKLNLRDILVPEYKDQFDAYLETIQREGAAHGLMVVQTRGGERRIWEYHNTLRTEGVVQPIVRGLARDITESKHAEEALRKSEEKFAKGFRASPFWMAITTLDQGIYLEVNDAFCQVTGFSREEVLGRSSVEIGLWAQPEDRQRFKSLLQEHGSFHEQEVLVRRKDGRAINGLWSAERIELDGQTCLISTMRDVTELRRAEERFQALVEQSPFGVSLISADGRYLYVNPRFVEMFGYTLQEVPTGRDWMAKAYPEPAYRRQVLKSWVADLKASEPGEARPRTYEVTCKDGSPKTILFRPTTLADGRQLVTYEDVTERMRYEQALRLSEEKFSKAFQHSPLWVVISTLEQGRYLEVNETFLKDTGFSREEVLGRTTTELGLRVNPQEREAMVQQLQERGFVHNLEVKRRLRSGEVWDMLLSAELLPMPGEEAIIVALSDITALKKEERAREALEAQLRQAHKLEAIGTLAGGIAHDFNNILAAMMGYTELSLYDLPPDSAVSEYLREVLKAGQRATGLVRQILSFSRQRGQEKGPLHLIPVIQETVKLLRATIPTTVEMELQLDEERDLVLADPVQMRQLLLNLCTNAAQAMEAGGGVLEIRLGHLELQDQEALGCVELAPGEYVQLSVSDTGQGMTPEVAERIFEPFFTTKEVDRGTGMGLAVVHGIVKSHDGAITVYSEPGQGTTFRVYLPCFRGPEAAAPAEQAQAGYQGGERILFVDDEEALAEVGRRSLAKLGYRVRALTSSQEALELLRSRPQDFDLLITDFTMPHLNGLALAREVLDIRPDMPIIICTGFSQQLDKDQARAAGIRRVVLKPLVGRPLARLVRQVLDEQA